MSLERNKPLQRSPRQRGFWTCQRRHNGQPCKHQNPNRKRKCLQCGGPKPVKRRPKHMVALELSYEEFVVLNQGDRCAVCLRERGEKDRRFDRDHCHKTGRPRGLLCHRCNRQLAHWVTPEWLRAAAEYMERLEPVA